MTSDRETLQAIASWLEDGRTRLPDHVLDAVLDRVPSTPQRRHRWGVRQLPGVRPLASFAVAAAVVAVVAIVGLTLVAPATEPPSGVGAGPSPSPTPSPRPDPAGDLEPGAYISRPLPAPEDGLTVTFTVPDGWNAQGPAVLVPAGPPRTGAPGGIAIQLVDVATLNGDPCRWSGAPDDLTVGPSVDDLVDVLASQSAYEASDPVPVTIGGYGGQRVDIVFPAALFAGQTATAPGCDDDVVRPWNTTLHGAGGVYVQGPLNRWQANVLDVAGTRLVVLVQDFPGTSPADRAELDAIVASLVITP
jgi:hypothetical protein